MIKNIYHKKQKITGWRKYKNILLQHFGLNKKHIPFISERNKEKVGLRCIGTDIELISEKAARDMKPNYMLVLPWYFKKEIVNREKIILKKEKIIISYAYPHLVTAKK